MDQYSEEEVKEALTPFHYQISGIVIRAFAEWVEVADCRTNKGFSPVLYSRTIANYVFDAIAREALAEFNSERRVRVIEESQTVKFCFDEVVLVRFKKANDDGIGQNIPTQAALNFTNPQETLPGIPPEAAKVEIVWVANAIATKIERVTVLARDRDSILWSYDIDNEESGSGVIPLPIPTDPEDGDDVPLVAARRTDTLSESE